MSERDDGRDLLDLIGDARVQFWTCPVKHPRLPLRVTVEWVGNVATCTDCGRTNRCAVCGSTDQTRVPERFRTHGPFCNDDWHRSGMPSLASRLSAACVPVIGGETDD